MFINKFKNKDPILSLVPSHPPIIPPPPPLPFTPIIKYNIYYNDKIMQINLEYYMRYTIQNIFPSKSNYYTIKLTILCFIYTKQ